MEQRINIKQLEPQAYQAMFALEKYVNSSRLTTTHKHLIYVRASQINGCAYCFDLHTKEARSAGETEQRIYALNAWRETMFFTKEEQAVLALTEEITLVAQTHVSDPVYRQAADILDENYLAQVIMAIITINAWNRIGISTRLQPLATSHSFQNQ
jgi:AhpD family alkylhydroperoxidase